MAGHALRILNIGGGFPAFYGQPMPATEDYAAEVMRMVRAPLRRGRARDGGAGPRPGRRGGRDRGRGGAGGAQGPGRPGALGVSRHRQVLRASPRPSTRRSATSSRRGTATADTGPCILAGPSCDSADVLYEKRPVQLPLALEAGDKVRILCTGAYTTSYSSVGFNGFPPLRGGLPGLNGRACPGPSRNAMKGPS